MQQSEKARKVQMQNRIAYKEIYDYSRLERAVKRLHLEEYNLDVNCVPAEFRSIASSVVQRR